MVFLDITIRSKSTTIDFNKGRLMETPSSYFGSSFSEQIFFRKVVTRQSHYYVSRSPCYLVPRRATSRFDAGLLMDIRFWCRYIDDMNPPCGPAFDRSASGLASSISVLLCATVTFNANVLKSTNNVRI